MKNSKISFWLLMIVAALGIVFGLVSFIRGESFGVYFLGAFSGIVIIGTALINRKKIDKT